MEMVDLVLTVTQKGRQGIGLGSVAVHWLKCRLQQVSSHTLSLVSCAKGLMPDQAHTWCLHAFDSCSKPAMCTCVRCSMQLCQYAAPQP